MYFPTYVIMFKLLFWTSTNSYSLLSALDPIKKVLLGDTILDSAGEQGITSILDRPIPQEFDELLQSLHTTLQE